MDAAKVEGRLRHAELRVAVFVQPLLAQVLERADDVVHGLQCAVAQTWVRGMATAPQNVDALHHHALVQADRLEPRRLTDHRRTAQRTPGFSKRTGARHGGFFVASGQNQQGLPERLIQQRPDGFDD